MNKTRYFNIKVIYIAGPYTAKTSAAKLDNINKAEYLAKQLTLLGYTCIIPHKITGFWEYEKPFNEWKVKDWLERCCFPILLKCDAIILTDGWENSNGCLKEVEFAKKNNIQLINANDILCVK